ncbi:lipopolysaccharide export system protein LptA [Halanaerobium saccharolyticum]|uniref:Lipopolysaccharide export system protein LptA n=1 Tax=Halanaerobium saccharolyticum TaxID=43595 RepID=A0A4R6M1J6_9FIRM|nr:LptA/OstA family protein [Halanaerobium saccharolyticum]TDO95107.1 lipopolysaccharide export system protein LptA [Halanaerobium saccharolyticum]
MRRKILLFFIIFILTLTANVSAVRELNGDKLNFEQTEQGQVFRAAGNVELIYDELRITAAGEGIYRRYNGEIEFRKNVKLYYQNFTGQADKLTGNVEEEIFHLIGNAQIEGENSYLEADRIDFYQGQQKIVAQGNAYLEYQNFWAEADKISYFLDQELITLTGNVKGERNGESFTAQSAEINQKTETVKLTGQATLRFSENESETSAGSANSGADNSESSSKSGATEE